MKGPRILFTLTNDLTFDQRMIRICTSLTAAGYSVCLIGRQRRNSIALSKQAYEQKRLPCFFEKGKLFYLEYNLRLFLLLLSLPCDAICAIDLDTILPVFLAGRLRRKKIIYDAHEYFTETPEVIRRPTVKKVWEALARFCVPRIKLAYTVGAELQKILSERYGIPFSLVRNVPLRKKKPVEAKVYPPILLYQGALNEGRGLSELLQAMQELDACQLWLAGEGDLSAQLRAESLALELGEKVKFLGYLPPEELSLISPKASIGINLLERRSLNYYYSLANKAFDYVQAGVPAIHMDYPEYRRLNEEYETSLLLPDLTVNSIVKAIKVLLEEKERYRDLEKNCQMAAQEWIWEKEERNLLTFYEQVF